MASLLDQIRALFTNGDLTTNTPALLALLSAESEVLDKVVVTTITTGTATLSRAEHHGKTVLVQTACTLTVPNDLGPGFTCVLIQDGSGQITLAADSGVTFLVSAAHSAPYTSADDGSQIGLQQIDETVRIAVGGNLT